MCTMNGQLGTRTFLAATFTVLAISTSTSTALQGSVQESPAVVDSHKKVSQVSAVEDFVRLVQSVDEAIAKRQKEGDIKWTAASAGKTLWIATGNGIGAEHAESAKAYLRKFAEGLANARAGIQLEAAWASPDILVVRALNASPADGRPVSKSFEKIPAEELSWAFAGLAQLSKSENDAEGLRFAASSQLLMTHFFMIAGNNASSESGLKLLSGHAPQLVSTVLRRSTETLWWLCNRHDMTLEQRLQIRDYLLRRGEPAWSRSIGRLMRQGLVKQAREDWKGDEAKNMTERAEAIIRAFETSDDTQSMSKAWDSIQDVQKVQLATLSDKMVDEIRVDRRMFDQYRAMRAEWAGLVMTLGARAYKDIYGQFPENFDALRRSGLGEVQSDACSGLDIRVRRDSKKFLLYSLGADGIDNGGKLPVENHVPWAAFLRDVREDGGDRVWIDER